MSDDEKISWFMLFMSVFMTAVISLALCSSYHDWWWQRKAIEHNAATWVVKKQIDGKAEFVWKDELTAEDEAK